MKISQAKGGRTTEAWVGAAHSRQSAAWLCLTGMVPVCPQGCALCSPYKDDPWSVTKGN